MRWASVVRAQMQLLVETYHCNGRTQAAGVYQFDGMSARRPPCRVCLEGSTWYADAYNGALVGGDDGSGEFRIIIDR